jgi:hypothetical protein
VGVLDNTALALGKYRCVEMSLGWKDKIGVGKLQNQRI